MCGLITHLLAQARGRLGDITQGPRGDGVVAVGAASGGAVADGRLTRAELIDAVYSSAVPPGFAPAVDTVRGGYGVVSHESVSTALDVLFGAAPRPERAEEDTWHAATNAARDAIWGQPPP